MSAKISDSITKLTSIVGSPYYMAPEIFTAEEYDFRADIWSVGITAIEMATVSPHSLTQGSTPYHKFEIKDALLQIVDKDPPELQGE